MIIRMCCDCFFCYHVLSRLSCSLIISMAGFIVFILRKVYLVYHAICSSYRFTKFIMESAHSTESLLCLSCNSTEVY